MLLSEKFNVNFLSYLKIHNSAFLKKARFQSKEQPQVSLFCILSRYQLENISG